jgi:hypothetical protein
LKANFYVDKKTNEDEEKEENVVTEAAFTGEGG